MEIPAINNLTVNAPVTYLSSALASGAGTLPVKNLAQFNASWAVQVGETGESQTEIVLLGTATPSGTIGTTTANTLYAHPADTPVYGIKYDQVVFERSTSGTAGTATPISGGTISIQPNGTTTIYDDTSGSTSYAWKTYWRNSVLNQTSPESGWITTTGYNPYMLAAIRNRIRSKLFNSNYIPDDNDINDWINEWNEVMTNAANKVNQDYNLGSTQVSFAAGVDQGTITVSDFKQIRRVWMTSDGVNFYEAGRMPINEIVPNQIYDATLPVFYMNGDTVIGRQPSTASGTACILYYKQNSVLSNDTDTLPVPMQPYTKSYVDYGLAQAKRRDNLPEEAMALEQSAYAQRQSFITEITPRTQESFQIARMDEVVSSSDEDFWM